MEACVAERLQTFLLTRKSDARRRAAATSWTPPSRPSTRSPRSPSRRCGYDPLLTLIDSQRQWFKSKQGSTADETPRDVRSARTRWSSGQLLLLEDARTDPRFADHPDVVAGLGVRFYAQAFPWLPMTATGAGYAVRRRHHRRAS